MATNPKPLKPPYGAKQPWPVRKAALVGAVLAVIMQLIGITPEGSFPESDIAGNLAYYLGTAIAGAIMLGGVAKIRNFIFKSKL